MEQMKCTSCGAPLTYDGGGWICEYCGMPYHKESRRGTLKAYEGSGLALAHLLEYGHVKKRKRKRNKSTITLGSGIRIDRL